MSENYQAVKAVITRLINDQIDQIKSKKSLKLNNYIGSFPPHSPPPSLSDVIECVNEFLVTFQPPLELERLTLQSNSLSSLPSNISLIYNSIRYLDLHHNQFTQFPLVVSEFQNLEILDLSSNLLWILPQLGLQRMTSLRVLSLKDNRFKYLPPVLGSMKNLNLIEVLDNPLVRPLLDTVKSLQKQYPELEWVHELKSYLISNSVLLEKKISEQIEAYQLQGLSKNTDAHLLSIKKNLQLPPVPTSSAASASSSSSSHAPPLLGRSNSITDTRSKASKAARRMGLIIKKPEDSSSSSSSNVTSDHQSDARSKDLFNSGDILNINGNGSGTPVHENLLTAAAVAALAFTPTPTPVGISSGNSNSLYSAPVPELKFDSTPTTTPPPGQNPHGLSSSSPVTPSGSSLGRPLSRNNRVRSNTLKEIDKILEKSDIVDTEHKSGAYFRRLSTLQELPISELSSSGNSSTSSLRQENVPSSTKNSEEPHQTKQQQSHQQNVLSHITHPRSASISSGKSPAATSLGGGSASSPVTTHDSSPTKSLHHFQLQIQLTLLAHFQNLQLQLQHQMHYQQLQQQQQHHQQQLLHQQQALQHQQLQPQQVYSNRKLNQLSSSTLIKVARKLLFSFSESHSSIRRFTGFCVDKKVTIKMITLLYTTKANIESLVENLELMEDKGGNLDQMFSCIHLSISSFKQIMALLTENLANFVMKIDICFIRMLYLTVYGSFNELLNAYRVLTTSAMPKFTGITSNSVSSSASKLDASNSSNHQTLDPKHSYSTHKPHSLSINTVLSNVSNGASSTLASNGSVLSRHNSVVASNGATGVPNSSSSNLSSSTSHSNLNGNMSGTTIASSSGANAGVNSNVNPSNNNSAAGINTDGNINGSNKEVEATDTLEVDIKLYNAIDIATTSAQVVFEELTRAISKSAIASSTNLLQISPSVASKVKELTNVSITAVDVSKTLKTKLLTIRNNPSSTSKALFWEDVNLFLKSIIQTFSSVKSVMIDLPILNEVRGSMTTLTKATKDVTILVEISSYKSMSTEVSSSLLTNTPATNGAPPLLNSIPSVSNIFTPLSAFPPQQLPARTQSLSNLALHLQQGIAPPPVRTPLVASLGPAALAIKPTFTADGIPMLSPGQGGGTHLSSLTTPQSTGQHYAKNGMNPFDGLIIANRENEERK